MKSKLGDNIKPPSEFSDAFVQRINKYENVHRRKEEQQGQDDLHDVVVLLQLIEDVSLVDDSGVFRFDFNLGELFVNQVKEAAKEENEGCDGNQTERLDFAWIFLKKKSKVMTLADIFFKTYAFDALRHQPRRVDHDNEVNYDVKPY